MYTPTIIIDNDTGRRVMVNMFEYEMYQCGEFSFDDLWHINQPLEGQELNFAPKAVTFVWVKKIIFYKYKASTPKDTA